MDRSEERALVKAAQSGDARALRRLLTHLKGPVYRYGIGFCHDPEDASDVSQDVMLALVRNLRGFRGDASLLTWAYVVARNACVRHRRRRLGEPATHVALDADGEGEGPRNQAEEIPSGDQGPEESVERLELRRALEAAIVSLPSSQREVVLLRDVEGLSTREVARALRVGERAVKSRLHRARAALRLRLREHIAPASQSPCAEEPACGEGCPDTATLLSRHLEGDLDSAVCARLAKHVAACPSCETVCATLRDTLRECRQYGRARLPVPVQEAVRQAIRSAVKSIAK